MELRAELAWASTNACALGECPVWDDRRDVLHWIDVMNPAVISMDGAAGEERRSALQKPPGSIFLAREGQLLVGLRRAIGWFTGGGELASPWDASPPTEDERFNDGRCHPDGTVWIGTMDRGVRRGIGSIVGIRDGRIVSVTPTQAIVGNGICFSPGGEYLYFSDTLGRAIWRYTIGDGHLHEGCLLLALDDSPGRPDGCTVDADGFLWSARVAGQRIDRYAPDGRLVGFLRLPVTHPTHCIFGGPGLRTLYVTSARPHDSHEPLGGHTLAFDLSHLGVKGVPEGRLR